MPRTPSWRAGFCSPASVCSRFGSCLCITQSGQCVTVLWSELVRGSSTMLSLPLLRPVLVMPKSDLHGAQTAARLTNCRKRVLSLKTILNNPSPASSSHLPASQGWPACQEIGHGNHQVHAPHHVTLLSTKSCIETRHLAYAVTPKPRVASSASSSDRFVSSSIEIWRRRCHEAAYLTC